MKEYNWVEVLFRKVVVLFMLKDTFIKQAVSLQISSAFLPADRDPENLMHTPCSLLPFG